MPSPPEPSVLDLSNRNASADDRLDAFLKWAEAHGFDLYPHQEEAIVAMLGGDNVVLATPTGSGKSLVATAAIYATVGHGSRAIYTAPIKALVSEKFFELAAAFGPDQVGMVTGDAAVNPDAPILVCTAEILANRALREGPAADLRLVVMDEFHYYGEPGRGWAWQVPLLQLPHAQFLLMSATLGPTDALRHDLHHRTGRTSTLIDQAPRPVPLDFSYRETPLLDTITDLLDHDQQPIYLVHFTQNDAATRAQSLTSLNLLTSDEKDDIKATIGHFRFDTPIGKDLQRFLLAGIGLHHAGLLPKYRLLVEKLAQQGQLKVICGTDTLGVGINVPIRTVLFTQLCKYDGQRVRVLSVREFHQIAGRAGRKGFDTAGSVVVQAPEHVVENRKAEAKAANDPKKRRKLVKRKPPEHGYAHWDADTLARLSTGQPEPLISRFAVTHAMVLNVLSRPGDGYAAMRQLLTDNHESRSRQRHHIRRAIAIYRSLVDAGVLDVFAEPDPSGRRVGITLDLQDDFQLNQPLSLFALEAIGALDLNSSDLAWQILSVVESVLDDPMVILRAQLDLARDNLIGELKRDGVDYHERMDRLDEVTWPKPEAEFLEPAFAVFARHHPWVGGHQISPKSVVRDMLEHAETFHQFVARYRLKRSEGTVLRYLSECYRAMVQTVPIDIDCAEFDDLTEWLGTMIRRVDSSLLDEWENLRNPGSETIDAPSPTPLPLTANHRAFAVMVRNEVFRRVTELAFRTSDLLADDMSRFWDEHDEILVDADARAARWFDFDRSSGTVRQTLCDPEGYHEWVLEATVDFAASDDQERAVVHPTAVRRL